MLRVNAALNLARRIASQSRSKCEYRSRIGHSSDIRFPKNKYLRPPDWKIPMDIEERQNREKQSSPPIASRSQSRPGVEPAPALAIIVETTTNLHSILCLQLLLSPTLPQQWNVNSGCGSHTMSLPLDIVHQSGNTELTMTNGSRSSVSTIGKISVPLSSAVFSLSEVRRIPRLSANLITFGLLIRQGWRYSHNRTDDDKHAMLCESPTNPADSLLAVLTDNDIFAVETISSLKITS